jgi:arylsulfatase A-like enzyme
MVRTDRWKLIHYPHLDRYQLFDLKSDPLEMNDLSADENHRDKFHELKVKLETWQREMNDPVLTKE